VIRVSYLIGNLNKEHGGAQQLLFDICRHLPDSEFDTTVYYMFGEGTYREHFENQGTTVVDLAASSNYDWTAFYELVKYLRLADYNIIHTNSPISGSWGRVAAKLSNTPNIVSVEHNVHTEYSRFTRTVNGLSLPLANTVVGVSQAVSDSYLNWEKFLLGDTHRETIWNGVDIEAIRDTFDRSDEVLQEFTPFLSEDFILGTMGRIHEQKGYNYLIRAFPEIKAHAANVKLLVIGDGPKREQLEKVADQTGFSEDIYFTGYVPNVYPFLPNFDIAVFPSRWEGFGLTPIESMVAERPVVGTNIPPFREVIGNAGVLVEPESSSALAERIISLIQNQECRRELGRAGYERATEKFSIERTVEEYASLYRALTNE